MSVVVILPRASSVIAPPLTLELEFSVPPVVSRIPPLGNKGFPLLPLAIRVILPPLELLELVLIFPTVILTPEILISLPGAVIDWV